VVKGLAIRSDFTREIVFTEIRRKIYEELGSIGGRAMVEISVGVESRG
jgi:hypothetical protein